MNKAIIFTGSPRKNGNTMQMAQWMEDALKEKGALALRFDTAFLKISGCKVCQGCYSTGRACTIDDDFNRIAEEIETADVLVFAAPVYWYTFPTQIKSLFDRLFAMYKGKRLFNDKKCVLLSACGDEESDTFDGMVFAYEKTIALMQGTNAGELLYPEIYDPGEILSTDAKEKIEDLADKLI